MAMGKSIEEEVISINIWPILIDPGGIEITLDAEKMGELINLKPKLVLEDCNQGNVMNQWHCSILWKFYQYMKIIYSQLE